MSNANANPTLAETAQKVVGDVKTKAAGLTDTVTRTAKDGATQLGEAASDLAGSARDKMEAAVTRQKSVGADYLSSFAQTTDRAAMEFDGEYPQAAEYIRIASSKVQDVADHVRQRDVREIVGEVQTFAKEQPTLFFGGALLLGFAAVRFLKSTAPQAPAANQGNQGAARMREG